jgi:hypothetical protein
MSRLYTPVSLTSSVLIHGGNLQANQNDGGTIPTEDAYISNSVNISSPFLPFKLGVGSAFTALDAGVMQSASYNELIINVKPTLTISSNGTLSVSTSKSIEAYRQVAATGRPFWLIVIASGYDLVPFQASATQAVNLAQTVLNKLWNDLITFQITPNFRGFAFIGADLNIVFTDGSSITRVMQNQLVQACWMLGVSASFITPRPDDYLSRIGPTLAANVNSGAQLDPPLLGCNPAQQDKLVIIYPNVQSGSFNISIMVGQLASILTPTNQDPGFQPNYTIAYVLYVDDSFFTADGTGGVTATTIETTFLNIFTFLATVGLTEFGLFTVSASTLGITGLNFPSPYSMLPPDSAVNTTGSSIVYGDDTAVFVQYSDGSGGNVIVEFGANFTESG